MIQAIVWSVILLGCYSILADVGSAMRVPIAAAFISAMGGIVWVVGGLTVLVQEGGYPCEQLGDNLAAFLGPFIEISATR